MTADLIKTCIVTPSWYATFFYVLIGVYMILIVMKVIFWNNGEQFTIASMFAHAGNSHMCGHQLGGR